MTDDIHSRFKKSCVLQLPTLPKHWASGGQKLHYCPLAVTRLKAIRAARAEGKVLTQEEEAQLPGCPWAIKSQMSGYCWFIYEATSMPEHTTLDADIAAILDLPVDQVKSSAASGVQKILSNPDISSLKDALASGTSESRLSLEDEHVYFD